MSLSVTFADLLRRHRLDAELTQEALAERAGLSVNGIQKLESGGTRPQRETVRRLISALQLEPDALAAFQESAHALGTPRQRPANGHIASALPAPLTSFVGRERDTIEVAHLLPTTRLLTLTGVGGCGKTRLALEVARLVGDQFPDGVCLVELAALADPELVPQAVASTLGVRDAPTQPLMTSLVGALRSRRLLLVLDNCEHLLDGCARLANALLTACSGVQILATSREPLGVTGELSWRVPSLAVPPAMAVASPVELAGYASVELFVARARAFAPSFSISERNAGAIAQICQRLDGLPLALELAAALLRGLSIDDVAARLDQRFRLLTDGSRAALPRQRTLQATLDWSYDLLAPDERVVFSRLSIFGGRWLLDSAEAVASGDGIEPEQVLELLLHLVDKSLVVADEGADGRRQYRLLDTLREYGRERLLASGESERVHRCHADYYLALAARAEPELDQSGQAESIGRLAFEQTEVWAALVRLAARGEIQDALRLAAVLGHFWQLRGQLHEGRRRLVSILALPGADAPTLARAKVLAAAGALALYQGDLAATRALLKESLALYRQFDHASGVAWVLFHLGWMCHDHNRQRAARRLLHQALALFRVLGDGRGTARTLNALGLVAIIEGKPDLACSLHEESLALSRAEDDRWGIAWALTNYGIDRVGLAKLGRGEARAALPLLEEGLAMWQELGEQRHLAFTFMNLADAAMQDGAFDLARPRLERSLDLFSDLEDTTGLYYSLCVGSELLWRLGRRESAVRLIGATSGRLMVEMGRTNPMRDLLVRVRLDEARSTLGTEQVDAWLAAGRVLSASEGVAYLRASLADGSPSGPLDAAADQLLVDG